MTYFNHVVWTRVLHLGLFLLLGSALAWAQQHTSHQPYDLQTFGMFRDLVSTGDFTPKVLLRDAMSKRPTTGVGAVADARGEITIFEGRLIVSYGRQAPRPLAEDESAALLATGSVNRWQSIPVDHDVPPGEMESFIANTATAHGIAPEASFPFHIRGTLVSYVMHVNAAPTKASHGMGQPIANAMERKGDAVDGMVAGFYVSPDLVGIVSHGGTRTHGHWVAPDGNFNCAS